MLVERLARRVGDADEVALRSGLVDLLDDRRPDQPLAGSSGVVGSPRMPITARIVSADGLAVAAEQDHRRRAVAGDVGPAGVDHVGQVDLCGKNSSISFLPNSRFMNELAVIWPTNPPARMPAADGKIEEPLHEWHSQRVLACGRPSTARGTPG